MIKQQNNAQRVSKRTMTICSVLKKSILNAFISNDIVLKYLSNQFLKYEQYFIS